MTGYIAQCAGNGCGTFLQCGDFSIRIYTDDIWFITFPDKKSFITGGKCLARRRELNGVRILFLHKKDRIRCCQSIVRQNEVLSLSSAKRWIFNIGNIDLSLMKYSMYAINNFGTSNIICIQNTTCSYRCNIRVRAKVGRSRITVKKIEILCIPYCHGN